MAALAATTPMTATTAALQASEPGGIIRFLRHAHSCCSHNSTANSSPAELNCSSSCRSNDKPGAADKAPRCVAPGCPSSRSSDENSSVKASGFRKHFEFLSLRHRGRSRSGSCQGLKGPGAQPCSCNVFHIPSVCRKVKGLVCRMADPAGAIERCCCGGRCSAPSAQLVNVATVSKHEATLSMHILTL